MPKEGIVDNLGLKVRRRSFRMLHQLAIIDLKNVFENFILPIQEDQSNFSPQTYYFYLHSVISYTALKKFLETNRNCLNSLRKNVERYLQKKERIFSFSTRWDGLERKNEFKFSK
jgi:hypothetical protein